MTRTTYIKNANVVLYTDHALVDSEHTHERYRVTIDRGVSIACSCPDFYQRSKRDPSHVCKHMEATDVALCASLPLLNTNEGKALIRSLKKVFKTSRRSAMNIRLVASLQIAENVKVFMKKGVLIVKASVIEQQKAA